MDKTKRARIFTGMECNARCIMCYYQGAQAHRSIDDIRHQIDCAGSYGMTTIEYSGGEPSVRKDLPELILYAKAKGMRVGMVTNGIRLADKAYLKVLRTAGLDEALFSIHGSSAEQHDDITQVKGSFEKIIQGVRNAKELGLEVRANTTVTKVNYLTLSRHAALFNELRPSNVNFILFNDWCLAKDVADKYCVKYSEAAPHIQSAITLMRGNVETINVRYIPFCFMNGYEQYVTNYPQKIYDPYEWSQILLSRFGEFNSFNLKATLKHYLQIPYGFLIKPTADLEDLYVAVRRKKCYVKPQKCKACRHEPICDGLQKTYYKMHGDAELQPKHGTKTTNPTEYRI
jgi:sulfatase maturation enzyme AslB (radical SAM superfamily)